MVYMKFDRSKQGTLRQGMEWPDVNLKTVDLQASSLSELYKRREQPLVLIAASGS